MPTPTHSKRASHKKTTTLGALAGRVALVTGGGVRVGRAIAWALAAEGATVAVHHRASVRPAQATVDAIRRRGGNAQLFQADLALGASACRDLVRAVLAWAGQLDLLVNNAAGFARSPFPAIEPEDFTRMWTVNFGAPFFLAQSALPSLQRRRGLIVNLLDVAAFNAWPGYAHYAASKAALAMLTRVLALELAPRVRVCGVAPGTVLFPDDYSPEERSRVTSRIPLGRVGRPQDVAQAVLYLAQAPYVTGAVIPVDGGRLAGTRGLL